VPDSVEVETEPQRALIEHSSPQEIAPSSFYGSSVKTRSKPTAESIEHEVELVTESTQQVSLEDVDMDMQPLGDDDQGDSLSELGYPDPPEGEEIQGTPPEQEEISTIDLDDSTDDSDEMPYIFTLDSMGSNHPQAQKILQQYLVEEAKDKKNVTEVRLATKRKVQVPSQPNFCDCGVYLLHFVKVFLAYPEAAFDRMRTPKPSNKVTKEETKRQWEADDIHLMRDILVARILELSKEWKSTIARGTKRTSDSTERDKGPSSDHEVEGLLDTVAPSEGAVVPASEDDEPVLVHR